MKKLLTFSLLLLTSFTLLPAQISSGLFKELEYRNIGAFRTGAWVSDVAVPENPDAANKYTWYVAQRAGGVWKTDNNGNSFECISDELQTSSIGCVEIAPSNPNIIWIGTGEAYSARSSYAGNGVYKSHDGGKNWFDMGLKDSHHINRIIIHPENPNIVYVAAMGHLFSPNEERGIFKTSNGGKTWDKVLYINDQVGFIDLVINRSNPDILFAASYDMKRYPWHLEAGGPKSRIYTTRDGGSSWSVVEGGLPAGNLGRIGIDIHRADPNILYAVIQNLNPDPDYLADPKQGFDEFTDNSYDALIGGQVFKSTDAGKTWKDISPEGLDVSGKAAYSFNMIYADPLNPDVAYIIGAGMNYTLDGGKSWPKGWRDKTKFRSNFGDNRCFWIDPTDSRHIMLGSDGGIYNSWDAGEHMHHYYHIPAQEIYHVEVDDAEPYNIYLGLQDHETWKGPSNNWSGSIGIEDWVITGMWDGMYTKVDHENNRWLYFTTQFGKHHREDQLTGTREEISPKAPEGKGYRYTWTTPLLLSPHNSSIIYTGAQCLLRSFDRGNNWEEISPDLTDNDPVKIAGQGHIMYCTITSIDESPLKAGILWAGTDDGHVHVSQNHGIIWTEVTENLTKAGAPEHSWVSRVVASKHLNGRAYLAKSAYREDIFEPYVYTTEDYGQSWTPINKGLPSAPVSVIFEDAENENLLYAGTDVGVYVSFNRGKEWITLNQNMPVVPVRDLLVHPREKDLVVATYGRGAWIMDVAPFAEMTEENLEKDVYLFKIADKPQKNFSDRMGWGNQQMTGDSHLRTPNEPSGLEVYYHLKKKTKDPVEFTVTDLNNNILSKGKGENTAGLHKTLLNTFRLAPGTYLVSMTIGKETFTQTAKVKEPYIWSVGRVKQ